MFKLIKKDKINRLCLFKHEIKRFIFKNIVKNANFSINIKCRAHLQRSKMPKNSISIVSCNRCILSGRKKRLNNFFSVSRIMFLKLVRFGYLNGLKKACW